MAKRQAPRSSGGEGKQGDAATLRLADRWHSLAIHLLRRAKVRDDVAGLSPARLSALSVVVYAGPLNLARLAAAEGVRPPTMSRLVAALEDQGLVRRKPAANDKREIVLSATRRGLRRLEAARRERLALLAGLLDGATAVEAAALTRAAGLLERLLAESSG